MARFRHYVLRCTAFGTCYNAAEEWSTGFYMGFAAADVEEVTQTASDAFLDKWTTFFTDITSGISSNYKTTGVRVAKLDKETGNTLPAYNFYSYPTTPFAGTGGGQNVLPQQSLVASLQARPDAGLGSKGRMFLPGIAHSLGTNAKLLATDTAKVATALGTMFNTLNADVGIPGQLINASAGRGLQIGGDMPVNRYVQDVLVGDVYDTQRRRRNQLQETYSSVEITL